MTWALNVRFPDETKALVEDTIRIVNARPDAIHKVSKNEIIAWAVRKACEDLIALEVASGKLILRKEIPDD